MIFLLLAIICSTCNQLLFKAFARSGIDIFTAIVVNYAVCMVIGFSSSGSAVWPGAMFTREWHFYSLLQGGLFVVCLLLLGLTTARKSVAVANIRGGGEYGEKWHWAGTLENKQNAIDDFITAAEFLIHAGYTSKDYLAMAGVSNGSLLVAACLTQRPGLFKVALPAAGVMDLLHYQKFTQGWSWIGEYGSSADPKQFKYLFILTANSLYFI
ncbi:MAG: prolyl oligopeptidase family serine peptidase [Chrysiogenales bacterium]